MEKVVCLLGDLVFMYKTFKLIRPDDDEEDMERMKLCLKFWITNGLLLTLNWFKVVRELKVVFQVWLLSQHSNWLNVCGFVYESTTAPLMNSVHEMLCELDKEHRGEMCRWIFLLAQCVHSNVVKAVLHYLPIRQLQILELGLKENALRIEKQVKKCSSNNNNLVNYSFS